MFKPDREFVLGERITVRLAGPLDRTTCRPSFWFVIADEEAPPPPASLRSEWISPTESSPPDGAARPPLPLAVTNDTLPPDFPVVFSTLYGETSPGRLFLSNVNFAVANAPYLLVINNFGVPYFYRRMQGLCYDFKVQPDGRFTYFGESGWQFYAMDSSYTVVDSFVCGNGYVTDVHELRLLPDGHALLLSYDPEIVDMSTIVAGGDTAAIVTGLVVQELDESKNVVFQWRSWDHFQITDATHENLRAHRIDYVHGNAIELDTDGNLMISSRNMDEITKIDRQTGDVIWRWGGKHNQFTFLGDTIGFSHQHAIRRLDNGHVILLDNGNYHTPKFSRASEYALDEVNKTAQLVWEYRASPSIYSGAMGYAQRLANGNTLISWGAAKPDIMEVAADGTLLMKMTLPAGESTYRAYRFGDEVDVVSAPPASPAFQLAVGPNPFRDRAVVSLDLDAPTRVSLAVYDVSGRLVLRASDGAAYGAGRHRFDLDLSRQPPGLYLCRLVAGQRNATRKLLRLR